MMPIRFIVQLKNDPAAFERFAGLTRRRGFIIQSLSRGERHDDPTLRITVGIETNGEAASRLRAFLNKLPGVKQVDTTSSRGCLLREFAIVKVATTSDERVEIMQIARVFRARIIDMTRGSMILEATGSAAKIHALIETLAVYGIIEVARTGAIAIFRGMKTTEELTSNVSVDV